MILSNKGDIEVEGDLSEVLTDITMLVYCLLTESEIDEAVIDMAIGRAKELVVVEKGERIDDKIIGLSYQK